MNISFEGLGQWAVTFSCDETVKPGDMVKVSGNAAVGLCGNDEDFCGQVLTLGKDKSACAVQLAGFVTAGYSGDAVPSLGWCGLAGDDQGGVTVSDTARTYLVTDVDEDWQKVTFAL
jgi:hypothetical protein